MISSVRAEIITIGDEILFGQIIDTNTQWIGTQLTDIGIRPARKTSVGDNRQDILDAFTQASQRVEVVIVTGGLGPTRDDITKHTFCEYFGTELEINQEALALVTEFFAKRGRAMDRAQHSAGGASQKLYLHSEPLGNSARHVVRKRWGHLRFTPRRALRNEEFNGIRNPAAAQSAFFDPHYPA